MNARPYRAANNGGTKDHLGLHRFKGDNMRHDVQEWIDGYGFDGHAKIMSNRKIVFCKKTDEKPVRKQVIPSSIMIPDHNCNLEFEVSGEFDIGFYELKKGGDNPLRGMHVPSFRALGDAAPRFFNPKDSRIPKGQKKLQIIINRDEGSMTFAIGKVRSQVKIYNPSLLISQEKRMPDTITCHMRTSADAKIKFIGYSDWEEPENERLNYLFVSQRCPKAYGNLPYSFIREIAEFV